ncbi:MAG: DegV family protein [Oscillospiraceae bacterium]|nr:DegV family protein [Oscillospiraceae bacterium]
MKIKITADSTCDLSEELIVENDIEILPLYVVKDGVSYRDGLEITPQDIFDYVAQGNDPCKTAAVSVADYSACFSRLSPAYDAVIHINISAEFSSCYQNACLAAQQFPNVYAVDSRNLSTGSGHVVMEAVRLSQMGLAGQDIVRRLEDLSGRVEASFVIDSLEYLHKGGRCSSLAALGANLLNLKPCIEVVDGKMKVGKKYRGSFDKSLLSYVKERLGGRNDLWGDRIFITHTPCEAKTVEAVKKAVKQYGGFRQIIETEAGCTISSHCGPHTLGILFIRK